MGDQACGILSSWLRERRLQAALPYLDRGRVLDYGCGVGSLARYLAPLRYLGVDCDESAIETAKRRYPQHRFLTLVEFSPSMMREKFDIVVALAVIEHMERPTEWLSDMRELLNPLGRIVLTTPHPSGRVMHELGARVGLFSRVAVEEHKMLMDAELMSALAERSGLRVVKFRRFLFGFNQLFVLVAS